MLHARLPFRPRALGSRPLRALSALVVLALAAAAAWVPYASPAAAVPPPEPPNILLITTDDQAATDMAFMPFTRRFFAQRGVTFGDAISQYPLCCPARATLLTGQLSHNHNVLTNKAPYGGYEAFVNSPQASQALPTWLQGAGYRTMFVGKYLNRYGLGGAYRDVPPGWDQWNATAGTGVYNFRDFRLSRNGELVHYPDSYQTDVFGQLTREFVEASAGANQPFFIWESNLAPHGACYRSSSRTGCRWGPPMPAEQDLTKFSRLKLNNPSSRSFNERVVRDKPVHVRNKGAWRPSKLQRMTHYNRQRARSLVAVDRSFRRTVAELERLEELDNTLVIFTSDNGFLMGQHRWHGKTLPYQPSLQVPLLVAGPGFPPGMKNSETVALVDLPPTIAAAAGVEPMLLQDGVPLQPIAAGTQQGYGALSIEAGPLEQQDWPTWFYQGVRTHRYTYVVYPGLREAELYDRREDPDEMTNTAYRPAYRRTKAALDDKLRQLKDCAGTDCYRVSGGGVPRPRPEPYLDDGATVHPDDLGSIGTARQVVTITARNWRTGKGRLTAWVRHRRTWTVRRGPLTVRLGANGMIPERKRRHGSGETPAGTFSPRSAFGLKAKPRTALPYRRVGPRDHWVYDRRVPQAYNINQPRRTAKALWRQRQAQRWADQPARFPRALVMDYNLPQGVAYSKRFRELRAARPARVGKGSFIVHVGSRHGRQGWASMGGRHLNWLLRWMRPGSHDTRFVVGTPSYLRSRL